MLLYGKKTVNALFQYLPQDLASLVPNSDLNRVLFRLTDELYESLPSNRRDSSPLLAEGHHLQSRPYAGSQYYWQNTSSQAKRRQLKLL